jgi:hypothetical protein
MPPNGMEACEIAPVLAPTCHGAYQNVSMHTRTQKRVEKKEVLRTMPTSKAAATRCRRAMFSVKKYLKGGVIACK